MNWLPTRNNPGWFEWSEDDKPTGITTRARCEYEGINGAECRNEPTHIATWPSRSKHPMTRFFCPSHVASVDRIPECEVQPMEEAHAD